MADPDDRYLGELTVTIHRVSSLHKVSSFGIMDPYIQIGLNQEKKHTRTITDGGPNCEFNETLKFNIDCQKQDLIHIKVKHKTTFSNTTIGIFSLKMMDFVKHQRKRLKFQLVDEESFEPRGFIELMQEYRGTNMPPLPEPKSGRVSPMPPAAAAAAPATAVSPPNSPLAVVNSLHVAPPSSNPASPELFNRDIQPTASAPANTSSPQAPPVPVMTPSPAAPVATIAPPVVASGAPVAVPVGGAPPVTMAPPVAGGYQPPPMTMAPAVGGGYHPQQWQQPPPQFAPPPFAPQHAGAPPPYVAPQQPFGSSPQPQIQSNGQPLHPQQQAFGSFAPPVAQVAPFQTLAVGRPAPDSRLFDDTQYLGAQRVPLSRIMEIRVFAGQTVTGIQLVYAINGQKLDGPIAGAAAYQPSTLHLNINSGERLESVSGRVSSNGLESIIFKTNHQSVRFGASNDGQDFALNIPQGHRVLGFHGSFAPKGITSIGAYSTYLQ